MNRRIKLLVGVGVVVLLLSAVAATGAFAQGTAPYGQRGMMGGSMMGRSGQGDGPGMMGGGPSGSTSTGITNTQPYRGMMGGYGGDMMGGGMMGRWGTPANTTRLSMDQAVAAAQQYVAAYNNNDLVLAEIMQFANNFYVRVTEKSTGKSAFELLVNPYSGAVSQEIGPNMMWNTKYSPMGQGGMMGGLYNQPVGPMTVSEQQARANAQQFLDANSAGAKLADDADTFYGYYTMDFLQNGKIAGMLSVNGYTGQVWCHIWHGPFVAERELTSTNAM